MSGSGRFGLKRKFKSGSQKRKGKASIVARSVENTKPLSSYFGIQQDENNSPDSDSSAKDSSKPRYARNCAKISTEFIFYS